MLFGVWLGRGCILEEVELGRIMSGLSGEAWGILKSSRQALYIRRARSILEVGSRLAPVYDDVVEGGIVWRCVELSQTDLG